MLEHRDERARHRIQVEGVDEVPCVADLPAAPAAHEAPELLLHRPASPLRLLLQRAERTQVAVRLDHRLYRLDAEGSNELVFEVGLADVEAEPFHPCAGER